MRFELQRQGFWCLNGHCYWVRISCIRSRFFTMSINAMLLQFKTFVLQRSQSKKLW